MPVPQPAGLGPIVVVDSDDSEPALSKAAVVRESQPDLSGADDGHPPFTIQAKDVAEHRGQVRDGVAESAGAERSEQRQVLPHLRGRCAAEPGKCLARYRLCLAAVQLLEKAQVPRE